MSVERHPSGVFRSSLLASLPWLDHAFGTALGAPAATARTLRQIHSARVHLAADWHPHLEGDALISADPGVWVGVKTADCVPILLADFERRVVAAVHSGWRGTVANTVGAALYRMRVEYGTRPEHVAAALGPAIGPCCYAVGPEVGSRFQALFPERSDLQAPSHIDLWEANRRQLLSAGVDPARIDGGAPCSYCHAGLLHSFRRDREQAGRMISAIGIK